METNRKVTVRYDFQKCEETGRIDNFAKAGGLMKGEFRGIPFDDSDVYKVIEGAAYSLALAPDPQLDKYLDDLIAKIAAAQEPDGYLYTARRLLPPEKMPGMSGKARWVNEGASHELYNVGHLYEAAVAHYQATGKRTLLDVAIKNADLIAREFGPGKLQNPPGHEDIEIGLCQALPRHRRREVSQSGEVLHRHPRPGRDPQALRRVQPGPQAGHGARRGGRPRRPRRLSLQRRCRRGRLDRRRGLRQGHRPHLGKRRGQEALPHRRHRRPARRRGIRRELRAAQRYRLQRNLRGHRQRPVEPADVPACTATPSISTCWKG